MTRKPAEFLAECRRRGVRLSASGGKIRASGTPPSRPESFARYLTLHKNELLDLLTPGAVSRSFATAPNPPSATDTKMPERDATSPNPGRDPSSVANDPPGQPLPGYFGPRLYPLVRESGETEREYVARLVSWYGSMMVSTPPKSWTEKDQAGFVQHWGRAFASWADVDRKAAALAQKLRSESTPCEDLTDPPVGLAPLVIPPESYHRFPGAPVGEEWHQEGGVLWRSVTDAEGRIYHDYPGSTEPRGETLQEEIARLGREADEAIDEQAQAIAWAETLDWLESLDAPISWPKSKGCTVPDVALWLRLAGERRNQYRKLYGSGWYLREPGASLWASLRDLREWLEQR
jgi:hypothetical protein